MTSSKVPPEPSQRSWFYRIYSYFCQLFGIPSSSKEEKEFPSLEENESEDAFMKRTLHFKVLRAEDIGIPRTDITAVPSTMGFRDLVNIFSSSTFSRLPVYEENLDHVLGMVHIKDVLKYALNPEEFSLQKVIRKVLFISPSVPLKDLLLEMQASRIHLALVVDEYGGVDSLITIENVIGQIVGDIQDEHESQKEPKILSFSENIFLADARLSLEDFTQETHITLPLSDKEEDVDTIGGYVIALLGHVPTRGELVTTSNGVEFEVIEADPRRLKRLRIRVLKDFHLISSDPMVKKDS